MNHGSILIDTVTFSVMWFLIVPINILKTYSAVHIVVPDRVPEIGFLGTQNQPKNGFKVKLNKAFIHYLPNFWHN